MKITRFRDIPQLTRWGTYEVDVSLDRVEKTTEEWLAEGLALEPDFQRGHVWTEAQQSAYVEFILRGGHSSRTLLFNYPSWHGRAQTDYDDFVIVDGLQRLTAVRRFARGEIRVFGSYFQEFTDHMRLIGRTIRVNINNLQTKADVLRWYLELNAGGTPHSKAELERVQRLLDKEKS